MQTSPSRLTSAMTVIGVLVFSITVGAQFWPQWALNPQHTGAVAVVGQTPNQILDSVVYDPLTPSEMAANGGDLLAHYQVPLIDNDRVFMEFKSGTYNKNRYATQTWGENGFRWQSGRLTLQWSFTSDWTAAGSQTDFWEPVFHAVLANGSVYVPGAGGTLFRLNVNSGTVVRRINPFGGKIDPTIITAGVPSVDASGNIYYNVIQQFSNGAGASFYQHDIVDSWLVRVAPDNSIAKVSYSVLTAHTAVNSDAAPEPNDACLTTFATKDLPWPPNPTAVPPTATCGTMRPALNAAPAIALDGTIYTVTRAHLINGDRYGGVAAINADLTPRWWTSLRDRLDDGCNNDHGSFAGALLPANGTPGGCRLGATPGVDPAQNARPAGRVLDDSSSSITIAPDGTILYGAYTRYDFARGHLMRFGAAGEFLGSYSFGWDSTPAIYSHDGTYSVVIKDNEYGGGPQFGSYCNDDNLCPPRQNGPFFITQLDPSLAVEWKFQNTNNQQCTRHDDGTITCVPNTSGTQWPNIGFEWCINAPVVDANGVVYANSEDGNLYAINQGGTLKSSIFLDLALGAAYTPLAIGPNGLIYTENKGTLFVIGR
jgi:outer membrane protein assembly factor BamB